MINCKLEIGWQSLGISVKTEEDSQQTLIEDSIIVLATELKCYLHTVWVEFSLWLWMWACRGEETNKKRQTSTYTIGPSCSSHVGTCQLFLSLAKPMMRGSSTDQKLCFPQNQMLNVNVIRRHKDTCREREKEKESWKGARLWFISLWVL